jgi:hypothetical protein
MGELNGIMGIKKVGGQLYLFTEIKGVETQLKITTSRIFLKVELSELPDHHRFYFSLDKSSFQPAGESFGVENGFWKGPKIGLFSYNESGAGGVALFDWFHYTYDGPEN